MEHFQEFTVDGVLATAQATSEEYRNASRHFPSDSSVLSVLVAPLTRVEERLESIVDSGNQDVLDRLNVITIGDRDQQIPFLQALDTDMQTICTSLETAIQTGRPLSKVDVEVYAQILDRYGRLLRTVRKSNVE
jgi:hypothetical protein